MRELYDMIFSLPPRSFTIVSILLGFLLIDDLNSAEQNALGNFIIMVGQVVETNSAQQQLINSRLSNQSNEMLKQEINNLKRKINEI